MKEKQDRNYPISLFVIGFLMNLTKNFFLLFPGLIFLIIGIWVNWCFVVGLVLLLVDVLLSFVEQTKIRNATINSDNPNFKEWQDAILSSDWKENVQNLVEENIENNTNESDDYKVSLQEQIDVAESLKEEVPYKPSSPSAPNQQKSKNDMSRQ